jgi:hypothetical protein
MGNKPLKKIISDNPFKEENFGFVIACSDRGKTPEYFKHYFHLPKNKIFTSARTESSPAFTFEVDVVDNSQLLEFLNKTRRNIVVFLIESNDPAYMDEIIRLKNSLNVAFVSYIFLKNQFVRSYSDNFGHSSSVVLRPARFLKPGVILVNSINMYKYTNLNISDIPGKLEDISARISVIHCLEDWMEGVFGNVAFSLDVAGYYEGEIKML